MDGISVAEAARLTGYSPSTLYKYAYLGLVDYEVVGGHRILLSRGSVAAWADRHFLAQPLEGQT